LTLIIAPLQQIIARPDLDRTMVQQLGFMQSNTLRLLRLINDILEIVRMDTGNLELRRTTLDFAEWVPGTAQSARHLAEAKGIVFTAVGPSGPIIVNADPLRLEKVLLNLLSNAIKFTQSGGTIIVSWGLKDDIAWFTVSDTGIGISAQDLMHLFRRFHQVDSSATRQYRGLGLGLSLSRDLVERHGGRLTVTSRLRVGSVFRVELPAVAAHIAPAVVPGIPDQEPLPADDGDSDVIVRAYRDADHQELVTAAAADGPPLEIILEPEHPSALSDLVLVADDEPDMRRYLASLLLTRYRVILAADGEKAVALAKKFQPSLVMLDLMMPKLDGMEACRQIRIHESCCDARIVLLTARADDETKLEALQGGADDFMIKPFSSEEVISRVHNLLENSALQRHLRERNQALEEALIRLRMAEAQLIQAEKMNALGSLAAGLLHEINNPLNYAQVAVHLAREQITDGDGRIKEMLTDAAEGMQRIGSVISSLRTFAHPETDSLERPFMVGEAIDLALRFTSHQCAGITIARQGNPTRQACGSVNQISMVLVNLLSNGARAIRSAGAGREGLLVVEVEEREARVCLKVTDNGIGMDAERMRRVFDPFYTTSEPGQGMGLGLTICHTIVRNHQGRIGVDSQPGVGTTVWLELLTPTATSATEKSHEQYA
jgi:signal transduction histidine kinase